MAQVSFLDSIQACVVVTSAVNLGQIELTEIPLASMSKAAVASLLIIPKISVELMEYNTQQIIDNKLTVPLHDNPYHMIERS